MNDSGRRKKRILVLFFTGAILLFTHTSVFSAEDVLKEKVVVAEVAATEPAATEAAASAVPDEAEDATEVDAESVEGGFTPLAEEDTAPSGDIVPGSLGIDEKISLDLRNIEVTEALRFIAMKGGLNIAVSKTVSGRLFLLLNDVPIRDVLDIVLLTNNLAYNKQGEIYNIMTEAEYSERFGRKFSDAREVKIFQLKYAIPERIFAAVDALKSEVGRVLVDQESGMVLVIDTAKNMERIQQAVDTLEQRRTVRVFPLKYAKAIDIEERLKTQLDGKNAGSVVADERSNQVVVQTLPERMDAIAQLIESLDSKTKEVLIVAKIIKVTFTDDLASEVKWEGFFQTNKLGDSSSDQASFLGNHGYQALARTGESFVDDFVNITPTTRPTAGSKKTLTENLVLGQLGEDKFEALLNFLRTIGETKILSSPRITCTNNQEAKIHVGERQAYVTTTTTTGSSGNTIAESVTFVDVGIQLNVTPTINDDGFVTMKIKPEISSVSSTLETKSGNKIPIIDTSEAETTVMVKDKTSIIIAGLRRDESEKSDKRIPYLGDIPVLGNIFRSGTSGKARIELLVLLTPHVIGGDILVTGEPGHASQAMKGYRDYSSLTADADDKPNWFHPLSSLVKKATFLGNE